MAAVCRCIHEQVGKLADICLWQPAFFGSKPEMAVALFCHMKSARLFASRDRMSAETRPGCHWPSWLRSSRAGRLHGRRWVIPTHLFLRFGTQIPCKRLQNGKVWDIAFDQPVKGHNPCWWDQCSAALEKQWVRSSNPGSNSFVALKSPKNPRLYVHRVNRKVVHREQKSKHVLQQWITRNLGEWANPESLAKDLLAWALFQRMLHRIVTLTTPCCTLLNCKGKLFSFYVNLV